MAVSAESVRFDDDAMSVSLSDGRVLSVPLAWFPRLLHASREEREAVELSPFGLHWEGLDEDVSVAGLLAGRKSTHRQVTDASLGSELYGSSLASVQLATGMSASYPSVRAQQKQTVVNINEFRSTKSGSTGSSEVKIMTESEVNS